MKGIILAGGAGTRLYPLTTVTSKQLLGVYDKPMIYYPLSTLMQAGIRDILIISTPDDLPKFRRLLGNGSRFGVRFEYVIQPEPDGLAQAFILGREFIEDDACAMILGDNIFYGTGLPAKLKAAAKRAEEGRASVFGYKVPDPERFGVVSFDMNGKSDHGFVCAETIIEKPEVPKSSYAVTGLYFYPAGVSDRAEKLKPSKRGELEITDLTNTYLNDGLLDVQLLKGSYKWMDAGTVESLFAAGEYVRRKEAAGRTFISVPEEIAYKAGWITSKDVMKSADLFAKSSYGEHLKRLVEG